MNKFKALFSIFSFALIALLAIFVLPVKSAQASVTGPSQTLSSNNGGTITEVVLRATSDSLSANGQYTVNFEVTRGPNNTSPTPALLLALEKDKCIEGNGQTKSQTVRYHMPSVMADSPYCFAPNESDSYTGINLNSSNNFVQDFSVTTTQTGNVPCGSFQTDIWVLEVGTLDHYVLNGSLDNTNSGVDKIQRYPQYAFNFNGKSYPNALAVDAGATYTGKDLSTCLASPSPSPMPSPSANPSPSPSVAPSPSPSVSPSPSPSVSPSPSPSVSPSPVPSPSSTTVVTCNDNQTQTINGSTIICINANQNQNESQSQTNNNNQINNNSQSGTVQVVSTATPNITTLPKTGLPIAGLALGGLAPFGTVLKRRFSKSAVESANSIWTEKQFKA